MRVVNYVTAAEQAGVSKQAINSLKLENKKNKGRYPFFVFDPESGNPGIDVENQDWIDYLYRNQSKRVRNQKKKTQEDSGKSQDNSGLEDNSARISQFVQACLSAAEKTFKASEKRMEEFREAIIAEYRGMMGQ